VSQSSVRTSTSTQPLAPPQRVIVHQPPAPQGVSIGARPFNHQCGARPLAVHPQPPSATQAGVGVPVNYHPGAGLPAGHPQASPPAPSGARPINYHHLVAGSSAGQPGLVTPAGPPAVRAGQAPSRQIGPVSYQQQVAGHCAVHSQAFSGTSVGQASPVPKDPLPAAGRPDVPFQGKPMTSSRVVPPVPTANEARPVEYIQIDDAPSDPGSPLQPSQPAHQPDPSTQPSASAPPGTEFSLVFGIHKLECFIETHPVASIPINFFILSGACFKLSPQTSLSTAEIFPPSGSCFPFPLFRKHKKPA
jgi:hypothetical protein